MLWDWVRAENLEYYDSFGQYPACKTEDEFVSAVQEFIDMTMVPVTSKATFKDGKCTIRGGFIERWSLIGVRVPDLTVNITDSPHGEIVKSTSQVTPLPCCCCTRTCVLLSLQPNKVPDSLQEMRTEFVVLLFVVLFVHKLCLARCHSTHTQPFGTS